MNIPVFSVLLVGVLGIFLTNAYAETYHMYVQKMPPHWEEQFGDVLADATQYWKEKISGIEFETVTYVDKADFAVEWASQYSEGKLGYYSTDTENAYGKPRVTVTLGFFEDKKWILLSPQHALEITKHEIGHAIGLPYSTDPDDIMYPTIETYEAWQQKKEQSQTSKSSEKLQTQSTVDWQPMSDKYQHLAETNIHQLEPRLIEIEALLKSSTYDNQAAVVEINRAWDAFWWAKKYFDKAEQLQQDGGASLLKEDYYDSYKKFKSSYYNTQKLEQKIDQITGYLDKAYMLQFGTDKP